jgi:hypothetical protein
MLTALRQSQHVTLLLLLLLLVPFDTAPLLLYAVRLPLRTTGTADFG